MEHGIMTHQQFGDEFIGQWGQSPAGVLLMNNNWDSRVLRPVRHMMANGVLTTEQWQQVDDAVLQAVRQRLGAVQDLIGRGLTFPLDNIGITMTRYDAASDIDEAHQSMDGLAAEEDRVDFTPRYVPVPVTHREFRMNFRELASGGAVDTTNAAVAGARVAEKLESSLFLGATPVAGGNTAYGYLNAPKRITGALTANWADVATTGAQILGDWLKITGALRTARYFGPYGLYVPVDAWNRMQDDSKAESDATIMDRLMRVDGTDVIRPSENIPSGQVVAVQLTADVVDVAVAQAPTTIQWESQGGLITHFKNWAIQIQRVKDPHGSSNTGIGHYTAP